MLEPHNSQISYSVQFRGYPLSICDCNIHRVCKLGKRKLEEGVVTVKFGQAAKHDEGLRRLEGKGKRSSILNYSVRRKGKREQTLKHFKVFSAFAASLRRNNVS